MASSEKVCECGLDTCKYHSSDMYIFKRNNIQVNPECRYQYKKYKNAKIYILRRKDMDVQDVSFYVHGRFATCSTNKSGYRKSNKKYYDNWPKNDTKFGRLYPINYYYFLVVCDDTQYHINEFPCGGLRAFKNNMRNLFGYLPEIQYITCDNALYQDSEIASAYNELLEIVGEN